MRLGRDRPSARRAILVATAKNSRSGTGETPAKSPHRSRRQARRAVQGASARASPAGEPPTGHAPATVRAPPPRLSCSDRAQHLLGRGHRHAREPPTMPTLLRKIAIIARFTLLEALRTRLPWIAVIMAGLLFLASLFVQHIAIAETTRMQSGFLAASLRLLTVFVLSLHVAASMVREFND